jgi:riboflavin kinase/FMN adenylyltransferase
VYAGWLSSLSLEGAEASRWPAAISVSTNPTFGGGDRTVEVHVLDRRDLDLYGVHVAGDFAVKLRGTRKFDSADALVRQIRKDVIQARDLTSGLSAARAMSLPPGAYAVTGQLDGLAASSRREAVA